MIRWRLEGRQVRGWVGFEKVAGCGKGGAGRVENAKGEIRGRGSSGRVCTPALLPPVDTAALGDSAHGL